jgi:hypothetical protein
MKSHRRGREAAADEPVLLGGRLAPELPAFEGPDEGRPDRVRVTAPVSSTPVSSIRVRAGSGAHAPGSAGSPWSAHPGRRRSVGSSRCEAGASPSATPAAGEPLSGASALRRAIRGHAEATRATRGMRGMRAALSADPRPTPRPQEVPAR